MFGVRVEMWDLILIAVVTIQATMLAYLHHPKWKALLLALPIPFTISTLAVGRPVDVTNVTALTLLLAFTHGVRVLHVHLRVPIVLSIVVSAFGYCAAGSALVGVLPTGDGPFWIACAATLIVALTVHLATGERDEPGHRSPMPVWLKAPVVMGVILFLVIIKKNLLGFMTAFPMVGVTAAYEARHSLWTISRQIPILMLAMTPLMAVCRLTQEHIGLAPALGLGWIAFAILLSPFVISTMGSLRAMSDER